ncbi:MAG: Transposase, IS3/IS911 family, partial [uncultured Gemmatimonadaceae bacterium]
AEVEVHRGADRDGAPATRGRDHGRGDLPQARDQRHDVLPLAEALRKQFGGMGVTELRELRQLREENRTL